MTLRGSIFYTVLLAMALAIVFAFSVNAVLAEQEPPHEDDEPSELVEISAQALIDHSCDDSEWHFVITGIKDDIDAPPSISAVWEDGSEEEIVLEKVTGKVAHYRTTNHLDSVVTEALADIASEWDGQFNVSHGPCQQDEPEEPEETLGWIKVCKVVLDAEGNITDGAEHSGTFRVPGLDFGDSVGVLETTTFNTALDLNRDILGSHEGNDAECIVYNDLELGGYFYSEEEIEGDGWKTPRYHDAVDPTFTQLENFTPYSGELFNEDESDDGDRTFASDGHILLTEDVPNRILAILNQFVAGDEEEEEEDNTNNNPPQGGGGGGSDDEEDEDDNEIPPYAPYCGDGEVNQVWEQCDGGAQCTLQCQFADANQCTDLVLARVATFDTSNHGNGDVTSDIYLGSAENRIPDATWFPLHFAGEPFIDSDIASYEDVAGLAVERGLGVIRVLLHGSHGFDGSKEHAQGKVEFWNTTVIGQSNDESGNNSLESHDNGVRDNLPQEDEIWLEEDEDTKSFFWMTVTTADDAFFTSFADAPICEANLQPEITLVGDQRIILNFGDTFTDPGATASDPEDGDITDDIVVSGDAVDTNDPGAYRIFYNVEDSQGLAAEEVRRDVVVRRIGTPTPQCSDGIDNDSDGLADTDDPACHTDGDAENPESYDPEKDSENSKPVITLVGDNPLILNFGDTFTDPGATASDPEDGDITGDILVGGDTISTSTAGTSTVTYNVTDSEGLPADEVTRIVVVLPEGEPTQCSDGLDNDEDGLTDTADPACHTDNNKDNPESFDPSIDDETDPVAENAKPVITLIGNATIEITVDGSFTDEGATAEDTEDGDVTDDIVVGGDSVDASTVGTYVITYNVTDSEGLPADEVTRTINVVKPSPPGGGGGGPTGDADGGGGIVLNSLRILNERVQVISEGTALITWETNKPATSRVVYDDDPHTLPASVLNFGTGSENLEYEFSTTEVADLVTAHSVIVTNVNLEDLFYFRPISADGTRAIGIELSAILGEISSGGSCSQYLFDFIQVGAPNSAAEVTKLQQFLNDFEGFNLEVNGVYNQATINAVNAFQEKYRADVLTPWGIANPTSYVYLTTRKKVNEIYCNNQLAFPLTDGQLAEVNAFRALLDELRGTGAPLPPTNTVGQGSTGSSNLADAGDTNEDVLEDDVIPGQNGTEALAGAAESGTEETAIGRTLRSVGSFFRNLFNRDRGEAGNQTNVEVEIEADAPIE